MSGLTAVDVIRLLDLQPHPEGGYFRETFRDSRTDQDARSVSTAIYFLLKMGEVSRWHRVDAAEVWHWYAGSPLQLSIAEGNRVTGTLMLGSNLPDGERPQAVVPAHHWQSARSLGAWTLVGCTVAPGFEFSRFGLADATFQPTS
ncbi:MAG: cupin domain-containing protein [Hyphomicrobiaceae bacterium]